VPIEIIPFVLGPFETNTYLLRSGGACWVVDPTWGAEAVVELLGRRGEAPQRIVLTHGHCDHIAGAAAVKAAFPDAALCCPAADAAMLADPRDNLSATFGLPATAPQADELVKGGDALLLGETRWEALPTPGHTPGGMSYYCRAEAVVLTGDALFAGSIGRTDLPAGDVDVLLDAIRRRLLTLPDDTAVYPGHGPATTIGREKRNNPFL